MAAKIDKERKYEPRLNEEPLRARLTLMSVQERLGLFQGSPVPPLKENKNDPEEKPLSYI